MPGLFSAIAKSFGEQVDIAMVAPGGYTWQQHAQDKTTKDRMREKKWIKL